MHMLRALRVSKQIKKTPIIKDISLEVKSGEVVGLLGPNGAGKTTTFYILCGILRASSGEIFFDDNEISRLPLHTRSLYGIG